MKEIWKDIPGFSRYKASSFGRIRNNRTLQLMSVQLNAYGYYSLTVVHDDYINKSMRVHRLVALAFHGEPTEDQTMVNHINGIKTDNRAVNLEWCTATENNQHAHDTGLRPSALKVKIVDLETGDVLQLPHVNALAKHFGIDRHQALTLLRQHAVKPYADRYLIDLIKNKHRRHGVDIHAIDFMKATYVRSRSYAEMADTVNITIMGIKKSINRQELCNGCLFWVDGDLSFQDRINAVTQEDIQQSVIQYQKKYEAMKQGYLVKNYIKGTVEFFGSHQEVADYLKLDKDQVNTHLKNEQHKPLMGCYINKATNEKFPAFSQELCLASMNGIIRKGTPVQVTDLKTKVVTYWPSVFAAANAMGCHSKVLVNRIDNPGQYKDYAVKYILI